MSSRKRRQAIRDVRAEVRDGQAPSSVDTAQGERQARANERRRRELDHATAQGRLRATRRATRFPMDRFDTGNSEPRWDYAVLHVAHQVDEAGKPLLRDAFARWCDAQRGARFQTVWQSIGAASPAVLDALWMVLSAATEREMDLSDPAAAQEAEEDAACRLGLPVTLVRRRAGAAVRALRWECHAEMPPLVRDYARVRAGRWRAEGDARASDLTFR